MTARDMFDLTVKRVIRAPPQKVYEAFVKPELVRQWMGPRGFKVTALDMEPRAGGRYRITMQARTGEAAQRAEVDMRFVIGVVTGDQPRQHAGIRRVHLAADHGQAHARHGAHAETFQYGDVAVPTAHEYKVFDDRCLAVLH